MGCTYDSDGKYKKCRGCLWKSIRGEVDRISPSLDSIGKVDPNLYRITLDRDILKRIDGNERLGVEELEKESEAIKQEFPNFSEDTELPKKLGQLQSDLSEVSQGINLLTDDIMSLLLPLGEDGKVDNVLTRKISHKLAAVSEAMIDIMANENQNRDKLEISIKALLTEIFIN